MILEYDDLRDSMFVVAPSSKRTGASTDCSLVDVDGLDRSFVVGGRCTDTFTSVSRLHVHGVGGSGTSPSRLESRD
jgi:hypothetical protein